MSKEQNFLTRLKEVINRIEQGPSPRDIRWKWERLPARDNISLTDNKTFSMNITLTYTEELEGK